MYIIAVVDTAGRLMTVFLIDSHECFTVSFELLYKRVYFVLYIVCYHVQRIETLCLLRFINVFIIIIIIKKIHYNIQLNYISLNTISKTIWGKWTTMFWGYWSGCLYLNSVFNNNKETS